MFEKIISSWSNLLRFIILVAFIIGSFAWLIYNAPDLFDKAVELGHKTGIIKP